MTIKDKDTADRALAALQGLALGDALGMPTQSMSPQDIVRHYGHIEGLRDAVADQPIAPSMPAGSVTDDTEQAILLGKLLIEGEGHMDPAMLAASLLAWEDDMMSRGSLDLLGPSTKAALEQVRAGADIRTTGKTGTTNGAAMRVTPVGIAFSLADEARFLQAVHESCMVTHDTYQGWEAAALVAAAVSAGIEGALVHEAIDSAIELVTRAPRRGWWSAKASVLARTRAALDATRDMRADLILDYVRSTVGTSVDSTESVPAAFVIARTYCDNPMEGLCAAANLGGDTDTIGAMAGAILGASTGTQAFPREVITAIERVSSLNFAGLRDGLLILRRTA